MRKNKRNCTKILSVFLSFLLLLSVFPLAAFADPKYNYYEPGTKFVNEIKFAQTGSDAWEELKNAHYKPVAGLGQDWADWNKGNPGDYTFAGYKTNEDPCVAITGFRGEYNGSHPDTKQALGVEWHRISPDLNKGATGPHIWLYYTTDPSYGSPITNIWVNETQGDAVKLFDYDSDKKRWECDFNRGAVGPSIYMHVSSLPTTPIDFGILETALDRFDNEYSEYEYNYSSDSWNRLENAVENGRDVLNSVKCGRYTTKTQSEVSAAAGAINDAINDLEIILYFKSDTNGGIEDKVTKTVRIGGNKEKVSFSVSDIPATKPGWSFLGWSEDANSHTGDLDAVQVNKNTTFYAIFGSPVELFFKYLKENGRWDARRAYVYVYNNDPAAPVELYEGDPNEGGHKVPKAVTYDHRAFTLQGWRKDTSPILPCDFNSEQKIPVPLDNPTMSIYATYAGDLSLVYDLNGGSCDGSSDRFFKDTETQIITARDYKTDPTVNFSTVDFTVTDKRPLKDGACFAGWADTPDATEAAYKAGETVSLTASKILYAVYGEHDWGSWEVDIQPTCTIEGREKRVCGNNPDEHIEYRPIPATGHSWDNMNVSYTWNGDYTECTATHKCTVCGEEESVGASRITNSVTTPATCTNTGTITYTAFFAAPWAHTYEEVTIPIDPEAHVWGDATYNNNWEANECTASVVCTKNPEHKKTVSAHGVPSDTLAPTADATGIRTYTADFGVPWAQAQTRTVDTYLIRFVYPDNTPIKTLYCEAGEMPACDDPEKPKTAQHEYTFIGWDHEIDVVNGNATYKANFEESTRKYNITWCTDNGTVIETQQVDYNEVPSHAAFEKAADAKFTYSFKCWSPTVVAVTKDATYKATYTATLRSYAITWKLDDGRVIDTMNVPYGVTPAHADQEKPATAGSTFTFSGWDPPIEPVTGDAVYTAVFAENGRQYTVTFVYKNANGTEVRAPQAVDYNAAAVPPAPLPVYYDDDNHYIFANWDKNFDNVSEPLEVKALYDAVPHEYQETIELPATCEAEGRLIKRCSGCGKEITEIISALGHAWPEKSEDILTRPVLTDGIWSQGHWLFVCGHDSGHTKTEYVDRADYTEYDEARALVEQLLHSDLNAEAMAAVQEIFDGNNIPLNYIEPEQGKVDAAAAALKGAYNQYKDAVSRYTVTFKVYETDPETCEGTEKAYTQQVISGNAAVPPETPHPWFTVSAHYDFDRWEGDYSCITSDTTIIAIFKEDPTAHTYTMETVAPTCEGDGYTKHICACGHFYTDTPIPASGHQWGEREELVRPEFESGVWTRGYWIHFCRNNRKHVNYEYVDRADYSEYDAAKERLESLLDEDITAAAKAAVRAALDDDIQQDFIAITPEQEQIHACALRFDEVYNANKDKFVVFTVSALDTYMQGRALDITAFYAPDGTAAENVVWSTSDKNVIAVAGSRLVASGTGTVVITAKDEKGRTATKEIKVIAGSDLRGIKFKHRDDTHYIVEDYFAIFNDYTYSWTRNGELRFKVKIYPTYTFETFLVRVNGKAVAPAAGGYYVVPAGGECVVEIIPAEITYNPEPDPTVPPTPDNPYPGGHKISFWERLRMYFMNIINFFKSLFRIG